MFTKFVAIVIVFLSLVSSALVIENDVPANIKAQILSDLNFMYSIQAGGSTPLHQQIFGSVSGASYKKFFEDRIAYIGMDSCGNKDAVACETPFPNPSWMGLTDNYIKGDHPLIARMLVVFHEARHAERKNNHWAHDTCPTPFVDENGKDMVSIWTGAKLEGKPACDSSAFGSYGSSTILIKNIAKYCLNCGDKVKMDAEIYATDQLGRIDRADVKAQMLADFATP